jgi:hypothetical protein
MKEYPGLYIIALFFIADGIGGLCQLTKWIHEGRITAEIISSLIVNMGFVVAAVGLILQKGWGRNSAIFFSGIFIILGVLDLLTYYYSETPDVRPIFKGIVRFIIAGLIYYYLFRREIRALFDESPTSWCVLGLILVLYSLNQDTGNMIIDTFWTISIIVGLAITGYGARRLRKSVPKNPIYMNEKP